MSITRVLATAGRILRQLRHDHRTVGIVLVVPLVILTLLHYLFDGREPLVSHVELAMVVVFPVILMFLLTAIAMVRERTSGTLERLMTTPIGKGEVLAGYALAFGALATVQASVATAFTLWVLDASVAGSPLLVLLVAVVAAQLGVALGLLASAVSRSEFQAVQLFPVLLVPQILLCGLFGPRSSMAGWLEAISNALPLTYAVEAMDEVFVHADATSRLWRDLGVVAGCVVLLLTLGAATLRRRTP